MAPTPTPEKKIVTFLVNADGPIEPATYDEYENSKSFSVHAWPGTGTTTMTCQILVNGVEQDSSSATGTGSFVTCLKLLL